MPNAIPKNWDGGPITPHAIPAITPWTPDSPGPEPQTRSFGWKMAGHDANGVSVTIGGYHANWCGIDGVDEAISHGDPPIGFNVAVLAPLVVPPASVADPVVVIVNVSIFQKNAMTVVSERLPT